MVMPRFAPLSLNDSFLREQRGNAEGDVDGDYDSATHPYVEKIEWVANMYMDGAR